jgi:DNA polymerase
VGGGEDMKKLVIDIETYSDVDLLRCGVYKYASSENFEILLFSYSVDGSEVQTVDVASGEKIPDDILKALIDENIEKWAYNVNYERVCLSAYLRRNYPELLREYDTYTTPADSVSGFLAPSSWYCSQLAAIYLGLPLSLASVGEVLKIEKQKMTEGKRLIDYFSKPTRSGIRHFPSDAPDKWETYKAYNKRDVEAEMAIDSKVERFPVPQFVWDEYHLSEEINDRGIQIDMDFVNRAIAANEQIHTELMSRLKELTGLENPNSVAQMKQWLADNGVETESLGKADVQELLRTGSLSPEIEEVLLLRQQSAKSSVKKYTAMQNAVGEDGRARGMFFFYGANRTGRFAGRLIQLQNLPQNRITDLAEARALVKSGDYKALQMLYDDIPDTLSQLVRTAFVPKQGMKFIVADFSAIEARVIAWLAGEQWRMNAFANGEDIYCASASKMFGVPVVKHGINGHLRQKGKVAELACGYGGSVGAMKAMGGSDLGLSDEELKQIVTDWRTASPNIVKLWWDVDNAAKKAIRKKEITATHGLQFSYQSGILFIRLPSGRSLAYVKPRIEMNAFGSESITYEGIGATKKWERIETFSGKLVENIVQGIARDLLMNSMMTLRSCFIVAHVHDEIIIEADKRMSLEVLCEQMARVPDWAEGLLLRADGYECEFYRKD